MYVMAGMAREAKPERMIYYSNIFKYVGYLYCTTIAHPPL